MIKSIVICILFLGLINISKNSIYEAKKEYKLNRQQSTPVEYSTSKIVYDNLKNATLEVSIVSKSNKKIVAIEFFVDYTPNVFSDSNIYVKRNISKRIYSDFVLNPMGTRILKFSLTSDKKVYDYGVSWVKFSDGTHWGS